MKKLLLTVAATFLMLFGIMSMSSSAARYTELPITMYQSYYGTESMFTMTDCEVYVYSNETPQYTNEAYVYLYGYFNIGEEMNISIYCYDAAGNHIKTLTDKLSNENKYEYENNGSYYYYLYFEEIPDVTASIEIGTAYPAGWTNTYFYNKYINVYSADGRALGIPELLLPVYKKVGWHSTEWMYALDGRSIEVPYCDIAAYQKVGWYLWEDYQYQSFRNRYNTLIKEGKYADAFYAMDGAISDLVGTKYESTLYTYRNSLMDAWRKKINGPLAYYSEYLGSDDKVHISFRNVSYKTIKAFKMQFDCYDVFGKFLSTTTFECTSDVWIEPGEEHFRNFWGMPYNTDHIKNIKITQVAYSDNTYWYR